MRKIINTLKYGTSKVKSILLITIIAGVAAVGLAISAIIFSKMLLLFGAIICAFLTMALAQSFDTNPGENHDKEHDKEHNKQGKKIKSDKTKSEKKKSEKKKLEKIKPHVRKESEKHAESNDKIESKSDNKPVPVTEEESNTYDKKKLRKTMSKYKVKKDHRMVIIDRCEKLSIYQTPAYIWLEDKAFHMLLIEQEPRHITLPVSSLDKITYLKKVTANTDIDYALFKGKSMLAELFRQYLPEYTISTVINDSTAYKNLYGLGPGIYFTNTSASHLFDLLGFEFYVEDKITTSKKVNSFFKDTYKANIMLRDNVIDANGYADKISGILDDMARSTISRNEFKDTLDLMIKNKFITREFAVYYTDIRDKISH